MFLFYYVQFIVRNSSVSLLLLLLLLTPPPPTHITITTIIIHQLNTGYLQLYTETMFLGYIVLQLFCIYNLCIM